MATIIAEYLWLDSKNHMRSKQKTIFVEQSNDMFYLNNNLNFEQKQEMLKYFPKWSFDGSSTGQSTTNDSELILKPVHVIKHPLPITKNQIMFLVLCEVFYDDVSPHDTNHRSICNSYYTNHNKIFNKEAWFGLEQEFFFFDKHTKKPYMWTTKKTLNPEQGEYYCGINRSFPKEREIMNELYTLCLKHGIPMCGTNQEVAPSQWEYQIGPSTAPYIGDYMIFAKYILFSLCEKHDLYAVFNPKPILGKWNGSGCHVNISTNETRSNFETEIYKSQRNPTQNTDISLNKTTPALIAIHNIIERMRENHTDFIELLGTTNKNRLDGNCETSHYSTFTKGIGTRDTSVRIPKQTIQNGFGYFEDRRPGANVDYYKVLSKYAEYL